MSIRISIITLVTGMACSSMAAAQWFGPWGSENDLATAWGLEESPVDDPDEGPGETIDYGNPEQVFGMNVQSGSDNQEAKPTTPPVVSAPPARAKRTPPPPARVERRADRGMARDRYRRMPPPRSYRGYPPPRRAMPYYPPRRALPPPRRAPRLAPLPPYPRYRR